MLTVAPAVLIRLFWWGGLLGLAFAAVYDLLRISRALMGERYGGRTAGRLADLPMPPTVRHSSTAPRRGLYRLIVNVEDLLYFLFVGAALAVYFSAANHGRVRWLAFAGIVLGFLLWRLTVGRAIVAASAAIAALLRFALCWALWGLSRPVVRLGRLIAACLRAGLRRLYLPIYTRRTARRCLRRLATAFNNSELEG